MQGDTPMVGFDAWENAYSLETFCQHTIILVQYWLRMTAKYSISMIAKLYTPRNYEK